MFALIGKLLDEISKGFFMALFWIVVIGFGIGFDWLIWLTLAALILPIFLRALAFAILVMTYLIAGLTYVFGVLWACFGALRACFEARAAASR